MRYLLPAILLLGTQIASAQSILKDKDDKELSVLLNEVVITGTGTEHYLKDAPVQRSEERRVGKECRSRWSPYH